MTRSSSQRRNSNARRIAALASVSDVLTLWERYGAFTAASAQRSASLFCVYLFIDEIECEHAEVNWELCAELLNRKARAPIRLTNVRWEQPSGSYGVYWKPKPERITGWTA